MSRVKVGKYFYQNSLTNAVVQIIDPAINTQGAILRTINFNTGPATSGVSQTILYADTTAPTAPADGTKRMIAVGRSATIPLSTIVPYEIEVPAGLGVWAGFLQTAGIEITWDLVQA